MYLIILGAAVIFHRHCRGVTGRGEQHETSYLEYEAYTTMAEAKMRQVAEEIRFRWPTVEGIAIVQRVGRLFPKTPTVFIICTSAHRDTGVFDAARYGIDRLKEIVPVWKKEVGPGASFGWKANIYRNQGIRECLFLLKRTGCSYGNSATLIWMSFLLTVLTPGSPISGLGNPLRTWMKLEHLLMR